MEQQQREGLCGLALRVLTEERDHPSWGLLKLGPDIQVWLDSL